jgi:hypothetical protein
MSANPPESKSSPGGKLSDSPGSAIPDARLREFAKMLVLASRLPDPPAWLRELLDHVPLPAGPPRNPKALLISETDALL